MNIVKVDFPTKEYIREETKKKQIYLHHTVSRKAKGVSDWWTKDPQRVATSYVIETDGTIFEVFSPKYWAYHIGKGSKDIHNKQSIGIEVANMGALTFKDNIVYDAYGREFTGAYKKLDKPFRGFQYFAEYTKEQIQAVKELVAKLCKDFNIIPLLTPDFEYRAELMNKEGILLHATVRRDKTDLSPLFPLEELRDYLRKN